MTKADKIRALMAAATTDGERQACEDALRRVRESTSPLPSERPPEWRDVDMLEHVMLRRPVPRRWMYQCQVKLEPLLAGWTFNPLDLMYYPPALLIP